jgi:hypothetical protein
LLEGGVIVRGTPFRHAFPSRTLLPPPPPSDASSAFRCIFRLPMRLPPPDASSAPRLVSRLQTCLLHLPPAVCLISRGISHLPRHTSSPAVQLVFRSSRSGSSPLPTSRDITRHHATYHDVPQSPRYLAPPASLPLPTRLSRDIQRHPAAPASVAPVPSPGYPTTSLGYPTTSRDPAASPAAPCEIHDTATSSGPSHYPPTSLPSDPTSPVTRPALPHAFRIPLPPCARSRPAPAPAPAPQLLVSRGCSAPFRFMLVSPFWVSPYFLLCFVPDTCHFVY